MNAQHWSDANPLALMVLSPVFVAVLLCIIFFVISRLGGWFALTSRFHAAGPFPGETWGWQSARFRGWCNYNNCLTVGASPGGLYLSAMIPFRLFHPALMIPWQEIEVETGKMLFGWYDTAQFRIGTEERITVKVYGKLVNKVRDAAGSSWPLYNYEQIEKQTRR